MSSKNSRQIDWTSVDDINIIESFGELLLQLEIVSSEPLLEHCDDILCNDFCYDCESHVDECKCNEDYGGRYMREYDDEASFED
jgi:hypothetical protein